MFSVPCRSASQSRADAREQFGEGERLNQIIVCAQFESLDPVADAIACGKEEDRRAKPAAAEFRDDRPAVFFREHYIDNEEIVSNGAYALQRCFAIMGEIDIEAGFAKPPGQKSGRFSFV